jgi:hypothetical protein
MTSCETTVAAAGKQADAVATRLARAAAKPMVAHRPTPTLDHTPTQRCLRMFTMTEDWACGQELDKLVDHSTSPWNDPSCRPSQADKRLARLPALLHAGTQAVLRPGVGEEELPDAEETVLPRPHDMGDPCENYREFIDIWNRLISNKV